jgi:hypothetical protein
MSQADKDRVNAELTRLPVGTLVRVRGCPGLGVGTVKAHITEYVTGSEKNRRTIPLIGHCKMEVGFGGDTPPGTFDSKELIRAGKIFRTRP